MSLGTIDPLLVLRDHRSFGNCRKLRPTIRCCRGLPDQWPLGRHGVDYLLDRCARHLRVALVVQQRFVRRSVDYSADAL
jgi:hypothetical protein